MAFAFRCARSKGWARQDSNLGPRDYESPALTAELQAHLPMKTYEAASLWPTSIDAILTFSRTFCDNSPNHETRQTCSSPISPQ